MSSTQQPEALNLEEFRAKVTRAAREPLLARIAELEAVLSAMGEKGNPVEPADIPRVTDQDTHFFLAGWNGRAAQVDPHEHFRNAAATAPAHPAEGVPLQVVELEVDDLIDRLLNAQQDLNLAANVHMDQSIASASTLLDEVEIALRTLAATHPTQQGLDARDAAFEAVRKAFCNLQRYSFWLDSRGNVRRCADRSGNWVEFEAAHTLFEPQSVDAALAAQSKQGAE